MSGLRVRIGGDGPVVIESDATGWRLIVRGQVHASGVDQDDLHIALRELALRDRDLAHDAFGVVCNCAGAWEDEYTEEHGETALTFRGLDGAHRAWRRYVGERGRRARDQCGHHSAARLMSLPSEPI
jgi:hypothetical protein